MDRQQLQQQETILHNSLTMMEEAMAVHHHHKAVVTMAMLLLHNSILNNPMVALVATSIRSPMETSFPNNNTVATNNSLRIKINMGNSHLPIMVVDSMEVAAADIPHNSSIRIKVEIMDRRHQMTTLTNRSVTINSIRLLSNMTSTVLLKTTLKDLRLLKITRKDRLLLNSSTRKDLLLLNSTRHNKDRRQAMDLLRLLFLIISILLQVMNPHVVVEDFLFNGETVEVVEAVVLLQDVVDAVVDEVGGNIVVIVVESGHTNAF